MAEIILEVVLKVVECLARPAGRQISYLRGYKQNFENLNKEVEEMKGERACVQHKVDEATRQGEDIEEIVNKWLESVDGVTVEAEELASIQEAAQDKRCFKGLCPDLKARFQLSKDAVRQLEAISKLREDGRRIDRISYRSVLEDVRLLSSKDFEAYESRMSTLNDILGALKDPDVNILGIYGMGGIGKTTLAKEVARQVKSEFDQVIFVEVTQNQDIRKIQGDIADKLSLRLHEEGEWGRASSLCDRLKKEKTIFVILDNIWKDLDLLAVGIPHGDDHKGCKLLLTARSEDVLSSKMDSQRNFHVSVLKEDEAWSLFKKMAGDYIEGCKFKSVAKDVAKECAGLPVSIITVARALRNKRLIEWKDALHRLRSPSSTNFKDIQPAAYSAIELSYNNLEEELKKIFLLIAYTYMKTIDDLLFYGMGLGLFGGINHMEEARARVHTLVYKLKSSCMLLEDIDGDDEKLSIHDVVRDVGIAIASRKQNVLTVTNGELVNQWESFDGSYTSIVLLDVKTNVLPEELDCPQLELFYMKDASEKSSSFTIPANFFAKMKQVKVLHLSLENLLPLPSSLGLLTNLRALCSRNLQDIAFVGNFKNLEILKLDCRLEQLPEELGQLSQLKLLDLRYCYGLKVIQPNVLLKLSSLEELYIYSFIEWGEEVEGTKNASVNELKHLPNLTSLELRVKHVDALPRDLFFKKLQRFNICIGDERRWWYWYQIPLFDRQRKLMLELNTNKCLKDGLMVPLKGVEKLCLVELQEQDIKYFAGELVNMGSSPLKHLLLEGSEQNRESTTDMQSNEIIADDDSLFMEKVELPNLETLRCLTLNVGRIWQSKHATTFCGFQNLIELEVRGCRNLKFLFSSSIISSFAQLQQLVIAHCPVLEEIIIMDQTEAMNVIFPRLQILDLRYLDRLTSFCIKDVHVEFPSLKILKISRCPELMVKNINYCDHSVTKKMGEELTNGTQSNENISDDDSLFMEKGATPDLETLVLDLINVGRIWQSQLVATSCGVQNLINLEVNDCGNLKCLFSSSMLSGLVRLEELTISCCPILEEIIIMDQTEMKNAIFPQLQFLHMTDLKRLTSFCTGDVHVDFPSLKKLKINECPEFMVKYKSYCDHGLTKQVSVFPNLEHLEVGGQQIPWISQFTEDILCKLKFIVVCLENSGQPRAWTALDISSLHLLQRFHTIKFLIITSGRLECEDVEYGMTAVISLVSLSYDMKRILKAINILNDLEKLEIRNLECHNKLENLDLGHHKLITLVPSSTTFQKLTTLEVQNCRGLVKLLTASTAKSLVQLRKMKIHYCDNIIEVVADDEGGTAATNEIIFRELKELQLFYLSRLTSFCASNCTLKFPSLETLVVDDCSNMKIFSGGELSTPILHQVQLKSWDKRYCIWEGDLNTTIQQLYLRNKIEDETSNKTAFSKVEDEDLRWDDDDVDYEIDESWEDSESREF